jgi:alpha-amylase/alpha-mannosidase (GH57 family)
MTRVAILWHMHQPFYQDLVTGEHILPWVRLHALKDYYGMVALLREFPRVKVTFNLVPSLLVQLEAFARDEARDRHLELGLKPADALTDEERAFIVEHYFHAHRPRMIDPYRRYAELLDKRGNNGGFLSARALAAQFSVADIRDLQVWHKLVWMDPFYLDSDPRLRALVEKGRGFSEDDKATLRSVELEVLRRVIPEYREAAARSQVELSTSPFYHPILPLLCDTDIYLRTHPQSRMPRERFRHPEDAADQLEQAVALHKRLFGVTPAGVWPSEGSVSDDMVPLVAEAGFEWMATDEEILARTLGRGFTRDGAGNIEQPETLYKPYLVGKARQVACLFRDHTLSDLIGFTYASWGAEAAADDFTRRLAEGGRRYAAKTGKEATIAVILDGENAWEHYAGQGRPFLRALYGRLSSHPDLQTVTMSEAARTVADTLPSIFPGSWINGDFYIWIGHADDHRAWSQLADARRALDSPAPGLAEASIARAREELLIAEGSDWFWWYGDDHSSDHDADFDDLFRRHLRNAYVALGATVPEELFATNISTGSGPFFLQPSGPLSVILDGRETSYLEWVGAVSPSLAKPGGAMHEVTAAALVAEVRVGLSHDALCVRLEGPRLAAMLSDGSASLALVIGGDDVRVVPIERAWVGVGTLIEMAVPFDRLVTEPAEIQFGIQVRDGSGNLIETVPHGRCWTIAVPGSASSAGDWQA